MDIKKDTLKTGKQIEMKDSARSEQEAADLTPGQDPIGESTLAQILIDE